MPSNSSPEYNREWYGRNRERLLAAQRERREQDPAAAKTRARKYAAKSRHGPYIVEDWARMWQEQAGCCYLCGDDLTQCRVHVDHDHECCPPAQSCRACRRGLTCSRCNHLIGLADDDPGRLRRIADALEAAQSAGQSTRRGQMLALPFGMEQDNA